MGAPRIVLMKCWLSLITSYIGTAGDATSIVEVYGPFGNDLLAVGALYYRREIVSSVVPSSKLVTGRGRYPRVGIYGHLICGRGTIAHHVSQRRTCRSPSRILYAEIPVKVRSTGPLYKTEGRTGEVIPITSCPPVHLP